MTTPATITTRAPRLRSYPPSPKLKSLIPLRVVKENPGKFIATIAHEIRNPLSSIKLATEMLKSMVTDNYQKIYLDIILRAADQVNDIVSDLLNSSKDDEMQSEEHSIHQLLDEVLAMAEDRILLKHINVRKEYAAKDCTIVLNSPKIKIALTNIIINAIDAMPAGSGQLKLSTKSMNGRCFIEIEDNGIGISKENLKQIFKPYFTDKPGGMGLGLSTTLDILLLNQARVNVRSEEGSGTCFSISFSSIE